MSLTLHVEDREQIGLVEIDVDSLVHGGTTRNDVGHIKEVLVRAARKIETEQLTNSRMGAVAAGEIVAPTMLLPTIRPSKNPPQVRPKWPVC